MRDPVSKKLDPYFTHMKRSKAGMCVRRGEEVPSGTVELCGSSVCFGLNLQLHQEWLSPFAVAHSWWGWGEPFLANSWVTSVCPLLAPPLHEKVLTLNFSAIPRGLLLCCGANKTGTGYG